MNIFLVTNGFPPTAFGGVEIYSYDIAHGLIQEGHQVTVFCREADFSSPDYHTSDGYEDGLRVIRVVNDYKKITSFRDTFVDDKIDEIFKQYLLDVVPDIIHMNHFIAISANLPLIASAHKFPSIITLHDFWPICHRVNLIDWQNQICPGPDRGGNCPVCVVGGPEIQNVANSMNWMMGILKRITTSRFRSRIRQLIPGGYNQPLPLYSSEEIFAERHQLFQQAIQIAHKILVPSAFVQAQFSANGYPHDKIEVLPLGVNVESRSHLPPSVSPQRGKALTFSAIGSILPIKGFDTLINSFKNVPGKHIQLNIYGREDVIPAYSMELKRLAQDDNRIKFKGTFTPQERNDVYQSTDVLVVPSKAPETFSLVSREALLHGKPVIAARIGALSEIVVHGVNGFLFNPGDEDELTDILEKIVENPDILLDLDCPGPSFIPSVDEHIHAIEKIYMEVSKLQP